MEFTYFLGFLLFLYSGGVTSQTASFDPSPANDALLAGSEEKATFECWRKDDTSANYLFWYMTKVGGVEEAIATSAQGIVDAQKGKGFELDINNNFKLSVPVNSTDMAGTLRCFSAVPSLEFHATLTVMESDPVCYATPEGILMENETVRYTCEIRYKGGLSPVTQWSTDTEAIENPIDESITGELVKTSIDVVATVENHEKAYKSDTLFKGPTNPKDDEARNTPTFQRDFTAKLEVHWSPRQVTISPSGAQIYVGTELTCSANSNPAIDRYEWRDNDTLIEGTNGNVLVVDNSWVNMDKTISCTVFNTMRGNEIGTSSTEVTFNVYVTTTPPTTTPVSTTLPSSTTPSVPPTTPAGLSTGAIVGIAVAGAAVLILVLLLVYCCCIKRKSKESEANSNRPPQKAIPADQVRRPEPDVEKNNMGPGPYDTNPPPYDSQYDNPYQQPSAPNRNMEGLVYADLALDDTPRSRKPIQFPTDPDAALYSDVRPPGSPMV